MSSLLNRQRIQLQRSAGLAGNGMWIALMMLLGILLQGSSAAQPRRRSVPPPTPLPGQNVVQVVNESV